MNNLKQLFMLALVAIIVCCLFFGCCNRFEGLENQKLTATSVCSPMDEETCNTDPRCQWSGDEDMCLDNTLTESNVPVPEGFSNF